MRSGKIRKDGTNEVAILPFYHSPIPAEGEPFVRGRDEDWWIARQIYLAGGDPFVSTYLTARGKKRDERGKLNVMRAE